MSAGEKVVAMVGAILLVGMLAFGAQLVRQGLPCWTFNVVTIPANRIAECTGLRP